MRIYLNKSFIGLLIAIIFNCACNSVYTPKPKGYPSVHFPIKEYVNYRPKNCPYSFKIPKYAEAHLDTMFFGEPTLDPCWINIKFPQFNATLHFSYKDISDGKYKLDQLEADAQKMTYEHSKKADFIQPKFIRTRNNVMGFVYNVGGNAASSEQFYLTDTTNHFLRVALYFYQEPNIDSMRPIIDFIKIDVDTLINTLQWH